MPLRKKFYNTLDPRDAEELLNYLEELSSEDEDYVQVNYSDKLELVLFPPKDGADTDIDDAPSDEDEDASVRTIGKGVLKETMEIICVNNENERDEINLNVREEVNTEGGDETDSSLDDIPLATLFRRELKDKEIRKNIKKRKWETKSFAKNPDKITISPTPPPDFVQKIRDENLQPIDIFKIFYDNEFMNYVCNEMKKYAAFKGDHEFRVTADELYKYFAILFLSGYSKVPDRRLYWETKGDTYNSLVSNSMSRNRFELLHKYLHFNDNAKIDTNNRVYKIEPLIDHVNKQSQKMFQPLGISFSVDEAMEPYYGLSSMKQFIKGKPIRYGFKFWCLTTSEGYLLKFSPYCGSGDKVVGKTLGSSVCENLCLDYLPEQSTVYIDNYFNSLPLLQILKSYNINCIGTIRSDRVEKAPLNELKKVTRGSMHGLTDTPNGISLVRWYDNKQVTIATNVSDVGLCFSKGHCKRWSKRDRSAVQVEQPTVIKLYNQGMGGVDLFDQQRGLYRIRIRSKKWYWPHIRFCLNGSVVNMWHLYRFVYPKTGLLDFIRRIVLATLTAPDYLGGPKPKSSKFVLTEVRYDSTNHIVDKSATQRRCGVCGKCAKFICIKCNVALHPDTCFKLYHTH